MNTAAPLTLEEKAHLKQPVLVVFDRSHRIVQAGRPDCSTPKEMHEYAVNGYTMKTITLAAYKKLKNKWVGED